MINMIKYIKNIIVNFPEKITAVWTSPAADHLFTVRDKSLTKPHRWIWRDTHGKIYGFKLISYTHNPFVIFKTDIL